MLCSASQLDLSHSSFHFIVYLFAPSFYFFLNYSKSVSLSTLTIEPAAPRWHPPPKTLLGPSCDFAFFVFCRAFDFSCTRLLESGSCVFWWGLLVFQFFGECILGR